jgi:hypothetical protein
VSLPAERSDEREAPLLGLVVIEKKPKAEVYSAGNKSEVKLRHGLEEMTEVLSLQQIYESKCQGCRVKSRVS